MVTDGGVRLPEGEKMSLEEQELIIAEEAAGKAATSEEPYVADPPTPAEVSPPDDEVGAFVEEDGAGAIDPAGSPRDDEPPESHEHQPPTPDKEEPEVEPEEEPEEGPEDEPGQKPEEEAAHDEAAAGAAEEANEQGGPSISVEDGRRGTFSQDNSQYNIFFAPTTEQAQKPEEEYSLVELATRLPERSPTYAEFVADRLQSNLESLREDGIVFISCADEEIALDAAYALIEGLGLPRAEQRLVLSFSRAAREGGIPDIFFIKKDGDPADDVAVVVDAVGEEGRPFLDSLIFATRTSAETIRDDLRRSRVFLLCLVDATYLESRLKAARAEQRRARDLRFAHWRIAFLRPLLTRYFPSDYEGLERQIEGQRQRGWWSSDENDFCDELKSHIRAGRLPDVVESREGEPDPEPPDKLFRGDDSLHDVALYVATFFPNLNPREFNRLVLELLEDEGEAGSKGDLKLHWRKSPDKVLSACYLVNVSLAGAATAVGFDNFRRRDALLEHLETRYSLFLDNQFERVMRLRLLFHPSRRVADGAMRLIIKAAAGYPEDYDGAWLAERVASAPPEAADANKVRRLVYARTAELIRRMLEAGGLEETVDGCLQQLLYARNFRHALEVVKRLQLVPDFYEFKWLRQLVERGDEETRGQVYNYLFGYLRKVRGRVYELLHALEAWVPEPGRAVLSEANKFPLMLLLDYCRWTCRRLDVKLYGAWPSRYPLFSFKDYESAAADLDLLTRWLFHPGVKAIFKGLPKWKLTENGINSLIEKWMLILMQTDDAPGATQGGVDAEPGAPDAAAVRDLLFRGVVANASPAQQQGLLDYWVGSRVLLLNKLAAAPRGSSERKTLARQREVLGEAITRFKAVRAERAPSRAATAPRAGGTP